MNRRDLFRWSAVTAATAAGAGLAGISQAASVRNRLPVPADGQITVAFLLSADAVVIDFAGPWEVFANVQVPGRTVEQPFRLVTVAETREPVRAAGGMTIVPEYTFEDCPAPQVLVIPAQSARGERVLDWIRKVAQGADLTMSVCTGAFLLAATGLLNGRPATTHHGSYSHFAMEFPAVALRRGARYVESGKFASAGGLSSGIDLALRVVERYWGHTVALNTADALEYQGQGWRDPDANRAYAKKRVVGRGQALCPVCDMVVVRAVVPTSVYRGRTYYFCMGEHKELFEAKPAAFVTL